MIVSNNKEVKVGVQTLGLVFLAARNDLGCLLWYGHIHPFQSFHAALDATLIKSDLL